MERFTVYLIHKWWEEGDSLRRIGQMLDRDMGQIRQALEQPLTEEETTLLERYRMDRHG
ncbi:MAG: hypothetical protein PHD67_01350 [Oscillospiraceae bacterium]|nr:hypothetical protein [Oscillospiraceae bacterium]